MSRGRDTDSWAAQQAISSEHLEMMRIRALRAYQAATKACEDVGITSKHTIAVLESDLVSKPILSGTGTQSASDSESKGTEKDMQ